MRANRYVSYLAAEIEPKALNNLSRFENATEATFDRIERFSQRQAFDRGFFSPRAIRDTQSAQAALQRVERQATTTDRAVRRLTGDTSAMGTAFTRAGQAIQTVQGPLGPLAGRLTALGTAFRTLSGFALAGVLGGGSAFALGSIASQYQNVTDRLRPFYENQQDLNGALNDVVRIARDTRQALDPIAQLYTGIAQSARDANIEQRRVPRIVETVARAARLSGGSQQAQDAAITQFQQAFGAGFRGSGQELMSIREQAPRLGRAIAEGLGVTTTQLRQLAEDGRLNADLVAQALERSAGRIDAEFSRLPPRIGASLTQAGNQISLFIGRIDEATGATTGIARAIDFLGNNINNLTAAGLTLVAAFNMRSVVDQFRTVDRVIDGVTVRQTGLIARAGQSVAALIEQSRYQAQVNRATQFGNVDLTNTADLVRRIRQANLDRARSEQTAAAAAQAGARETQRALQTNLRLIDDQRRAAVRQRNTAETLVAANPRSPAAVNALNTANREVAASTAARIRTSQLLAAVEAELIAIETRLAAANGAVAVSEGRMAAAMDVAGGSAIRKSVAMGVLRSAVSGVAAVGSSLVAFLGGPWGVAFTVAAGLTAYLATRTDAAAEAVANFRGGQEALAARLGITTAALREQSAAARELAVSLGQAGLARARQQRLDTGAQLAGRLRAAASNLYVGVGSGNPNDARDRQSLETLASLAERGRLSPRAYEMIAGIQRRNPTAFQGGIAQRILGTNPEQTAETFLGYSAAIINVQEAEASLEETRRAANSPPPTIPQARNQQQLVAAAQGRAAETPLQRARAELAAIRTTGRAQNESEDAYVERLATAIRAVRDATEAERSARAGRAAGARAARQHAAEMRREAAAAETAADKLTRLQNIREQFSDTPTGVQRGNRAIRSLRDFVGERVGSGIYTQADFEADAQRINDAVRRPIADAIRDGERNLAVQRLILEGRSDEAALLERAVALVDQVGDISDDELNNLREQQAALRTINEQQERRNALVDIYAQSWSDVTAAGRDFLRDLARDPLHSFGNLATRLRDAFQEAWASKISLDLFGNPEQRARDQMTRGLNNSAGRLMTAADVLRVAGRMLQDDAERPTPGATPGTSTLPSGAEVPTGDLATIVNAALAGVEDVARGDIVPALQNMTQAIDRVDDAVGAVAGAGGDEGGPIVVTGARRRGGENALPESVTENFNRIGLDFATRIFGKGSPISRVFGRLGNMLEGATFGQMGGGLVRATGLQSSGLGGQIGGALFGGAMSGAFGQGIGKALGSVFGSLGSFAGPVGSIVGGLIGSAVGGLLKKTPKASATITGVDSDLSISGSKSLRGDAGTLGGGVQDTLRRIADMLGGTTSSFAVSIGKRKDQFVVDPSGKGRTKGSGVLKFDNEEDAARAAVLDALRDGAIAGIRDGARRLLAAGRDLDAALDKALKFQTVFRRLKAYTDPVGAAIDDLNTEFENLKKIFTEAGASAEEWADLQKLYDFERTKAMEEASEQALGRLREFINGELRGSDSPLSRRDVYNNAKAAFEQGATDFAAGKISANSLVPLLEDFKNASRELNGSREPFFQDWNALMELAQRAALTLPSTTGGTGSGTGSGALPPSPFDDRTANNTSTLVGLTEEMLAAIRALGYALPGGGNGSALAILPSNMGSGGGGGGGGNNMV